MRFSFMRLFILIAFGLASPLQVAWSQGAEPSQKRDVEQPSNGEAPSAEAPLVELVRQDPEKQDGKDAKEEKDKASEKGDVQEANSKKEAQDDDKKGDDKKDADKEEADKDDAKKDKDADKKGADKKGKKDKDKEAEEEAPEPMALAADSSPVLFLKGARVITRPGKVLENAQVLVRNGRIQDVGVGLTAPEGARVIEGAVICASFFDSWSTLGVDRSSLFDGGTDASTNANDALHLYGPTYDMEMALAAGVTIVESHVGLRSAFGGTGVLMSTLPTTDREKAVVSERSAMWAKLERSGDMVARVDEVDGLVSKLEAGGDYLASWRKYEAKRAEWVEEIEELQTKLDKDFKKAKKDRDKGIAKAKKDGKEHKEKKHKEPKPPKKPRYDANKEALGKVMEGDLPLVVVASRAAVLRNLLEATSEFSSLRLIIAGGDQAMHVAPQLAARNIPVMVWPADPLRASSVPSDTRGSLVLAGELARAGVSVIIGSGSGGSSAALPLYAALAVGYGLPEDHALAAITTRPAQAFDMQSELGLVRRGRRAELLVLNGDPLSVGTQVQFVVSNGEVVVEPKE